MFFWTKKEKEKLFGLLSHISEEIKSSNISITDSIGGLDMSIEDLGVLISSSASDISVKLDDLHVTIEGELVIEDDGEQNGGEEPVGEDVNDLTNWWQRELHLLPRFAYDQKVGYGYVIGEKVPLLMELKDHSLYPYTNTSWGANSEAQRVIAKEPKLLMIYAKGDTWQDANNPEIRPFSFDGGALAYKVVPYQIVDGKYLAERVDVDLYIYMNDLGMPFFPPEE